jgi:hypothetical protein
VANPKAWLPHFGETAQKRTFFVGSALVLSLGIHIAIPASGWFHSVQPISDGPVTFELIPPPPVPLPEAEDLKVAPDEEDVDAPDSDEPAANEEEAAVKAPEKLDKPPPEKPDEKPPEEPAPEDKPPEEAAEPPKLAENGEPVSKEQLEKDKQAERDRKRAERLAERRRRLEERRKRRASGGEKGGAPDPGDWKTGKPEAVYACTATSRGEELKVNKSRPLYEWATILPTLTSGFRTKPDVGDYLDEIQQVVSRDRKTLRRIGFVEMALPKEALTVELDDPHGSKLVMGRSDGRCLVGFRYTANIFPFVVQRVPMRIVEKGAKTDALVDITFFKDVSFEMKSVDGTVLPFKQGRLKNGKAITQNIEDHYQAARLAKSIAEVFGISLTPKSANTTTTTPTGKKAPSVNVYKAIAEGKPVKVQE